MHYEDISLNELGFLSSHQAHMISMVLLAYECLRSPKTSSSASARLRFSTYDIGSLVHTSFSWNVWLFKHRNVFVLSKSIKIDFKLKN